MKETNQIKLTLEKHVLDTMKEWQLKIGSLDQDIRLYYPKKSLCEFLEVEDTIEIDKLVKAVTEYLQNKAAFLGDITTTVAGDRLCIEIGKEGCQYVEQFVEEPEFLKLFLEALKKQKMEEMVHLFEEYAKKEGTTYIVDKEQDGLGTVLYFADSRVDPYVYCLEEDDFGITYHRFARNDYRDLKEE